MILKELLRSSFSRKILILCITFIRSVVLLGAPLITKFILNDILPQKRQEMLVILCIVLILLPLVTCSLIIIDLYMSSFVITNGKNLRIRLFQEILAHPKLLYSKEELLHLLLDETEELVNMLFRGIGNIFWLASTIIIGFLIMLGTNLRLGSLLLIVNVGTYFMIYRFTKMLKQSNLVPIKVWGGLPLVFEKLQLSSQASLHIRQGDKILFQGPSGVGKTSLLATIFMYPRDYNELEEKAPYLFFNGKPLSNISRRTWAQNCVFIPQKIQLYQGTLRENICLGMEITQDHFEQILTLLEFPDVLRQRLDSPVDPNKSELSGGQIQQIGIARALLRKPQVLVMDESTSAMDRNLEKVVLKNIVTNFPAMTMLFISHRDYQAYKFFSQQVHVTTMGDQLNLKRRRI